VGVISARCFQAPHLKTRQSYERILNWQGFDIGIGVLEHEMFSFLFGLKRQCVRANSIEKRFFCLWLVFVYLRKQGAGNARASTYPCPCHFFITFAIINQIKISMSFDCPNNDNGHCRRKDTKCAPGTENCILEGKVKRAVDLDDNKKKSGDP
jgi:hypothetical protein